MKFEIETVPVGSKDPVQRYCILVDLSPEDIPPPDRCFLDLTRELAGLPYLNTFTIPEFTKEVRERLVPQASPYVRAVIPPEEAVVGRFTVGILKGGFSMLGA